MCGIVVLHRSGGRTVAEAMLTEMVHRGPDDEGTAELGEFTLGARRLSIIDVAGGHQPLANETDTVFSVLNGEIYNHPALRDELMAAGHRFRSRADTEVLVHGYEEWGWDGLLERLSGMYVFALVDRDRSLCLLARDRLGEKPLYIARAGTGWALASEVKALFRHPLIAPSLDESLIPESLANRFVTGERTIFANVTKLLPGCWLRLEGGRATQGRYWEVPTGGTGARGHGVRWGNQGGLPLRVGRHGGTDAAAVALEVRDRVLASVKARLIADVPLGTLLSGGLDSSIVVAAMAAGGTRPVRTFTVGFEDAGSDERGAAALVARHYATEHTERLVRLDAMGLLETVVWHLDEPLGDAAALPTLLICRAARERVTVVLTGEGADELFLGYPRYLLSRLADRAMALPRPARRLFFGAAAAVLPHPFREPLRRLATADPDALVRNALWMSGTEPETVAALVRRPMIEWRRWYVPGQIGGRPPSDGPGGLSRRLEEVLARDLTAWLVDDILLKTDKMSMAASVEARVPFLDHKLVEFVSSLPVEARFAARGKRWLRRAFAADLPARTLRRRKHPFRPPLARWFRGRLALELEALVLRPDSFTSNYLDSAVARTLLAQHRSGRRDRSLLLWSLLVHEVWWRRFFPSGPTVA